MKKVRENIQRNLGYYLTLKDISQREFADELGVSQSSVTCWLKGKNAPDIELVAKICDFFNITISDLFGTDGSDRFTEHEKTIIERYRQRPELQHAVNVLLEV